MVIYTLEKLEECKEVESDAGNVNHSGQNIK